MTIPCITLHRPWSCWIAAGLKLIETRMHDRFRGLVGKWIGIHSGQRNHLQAFGWAGAYCPMPRLLQASERFGPEVGRILCVAKVTEARWLQAEDSAAALIDCGGTRRFGLVLWGISVLPNVNETYVTGRQGIFHVDLSHETLKASEVL